MLTALRSFFTRSPALETRSSIKQPEEWLLRAFDSRTNAGVGVSAESAETISTVFACVRILSESIAGLPLKLYRKTPDGREEAIDHPLYSLLKDAPTPSLTSFEWREMLEGHRSLRGNAYCRILRDRFFDVVALEPIHPSEVQPQRLADGSVIYKVTGFNQPFTSADILHLRTRTQDGVSGISPVRRMKETIGLALAVQAHGARSFANGNKFPGLLKTPVSLKPEQVKDLRAAWDSQRSGENSSKAPILHGGLDWVSVGMSNTDAELIATGLFSRKDIAEAFGVPLTMLAHGEKAATYASVEQFKVDFVDRTLVPLTERWSQRLNASLLSLADRQAGYYFAFNLKALLRGSATERANYYRTMREMRAMTINEIRAAEEMNDFPDAIGDNPREDFNGQGGKAAAPAQTAQPVAQAQQEEGDQ